MKLTVATKGGLIHLEAINPCDLKLTLASLIDEEAKCGDEVYLCSFEFENIKYNETTAINQPQLITSSGLICMISGTSMLNVDVNAITAFLNAMYKIY